MKEKQPNKISGNYTEFGFNDIKNTILTHRITFITTFLLVLVIGIIYSLTRPLKYEYTRTIQLNSNLYSGTQNPSIVSPSVTYFKLKMIINKQIEQYTKSKQGKKINLKFRFVNNEGMDNQPANPMNDQLIKLSAVGSLKDQADYNELFNSILNNLIDTQKFGYTVNLNSVNQNIALIDQVLAKQGDIAKQVAKLNADLDDYNRTAKSQLLSAEIANNQFYYNLQNQKINLRLLRAIMQPSHFIDAFTISAKPINLNKSTLLLMFVFLGLFFGFFAALFVEFLKNSRKTN